MVLALLPQVHRPVCEDPVLARLLLQLRPPLLPAPPPALLQLLVGRRGPGRHRGQEGGAAASVQRVESSEESPDLSDLILVCEEPLQSAWPSQLLLHLYTVITP